MPDANVPETPKPNYSAALVGVFTALDAMNRARSVGNIYFPSPVYDAMGEVERALHNALHVVMAADCGEARQKLLSKAVAAKVPLYDPKCVLCNLIIRKGEYYVKLATARVHVACVNKLPPPPVPELNPK